MKRILSIMLSLSLMLCLFPPLTAFAVGDGNIDGGGGGMGGGTANNSWNPGNEGVRVTVVRASDHAQVTTPIDISNKPPSPTIYNFGKVSKLQYNNGVRLNPVRGGYVCVKPTQQIPRIISTTGSNNIAAIKSYFTDEQVIRSIAGLTGMDYDVLIGGQYKIMLEPFAYYKFEGSMFATTATEAALYDEQTGGLLRKRMVSLTHKNLPLSMFLETSDLGYPAWSGSKTSAAANSDIKSSLGIGIVRFTEQPEPPAVTTYDYEYRVNTEVITSVTVSGGQSDPDKPVSVTFNVNGRSYRVNNVYYPDGDGQLAWIRWTTPSTPQTMTIDVTVTGGGSAKGTIYVNIVDLDKNPPPNPVADDRNDSFRIPAEPRESNMTRLGWGVWRPWWQPYWVWIPDWDYCDHGEDDGHWVDNGEWVDEGWYEFDLDRYEASLRSSMSIQPDSKNPTASGRTIKSGYGVNQTVTASVSTNQSSAVTPPQTAVSFFPEFEYKTYWRLLERVQSGYTARFEFQKNRYSTYTRRTHFSPIWYPDGKYSVYTDLFDSWTPAGMLSQNESDTLTIRGNLWQDWHAGPLKPK